MKKYPVVLFTTLFSSGVAVGSSVKFALDFFYLYWGILILAISAFIFISKDEILRLILSCIIYLGVFLAGLLFYTPHEQFAFSQQLHKENLTVYGIVSEISTGSNKDFRFSLKSDSIKTDDCLIYYEGNFNCVLKNIKYNIYPGYRIILTGIFMRGRNIRNPGEFDYEEYLLKNGITGFIYSFNKDDLIISDRSEKIVQGTFYRIRKSLSEKIRHYFDTETAALVNGLMLADRSDIDQDVKTDFINSGTAHVLAVSGLNVGYIVLLCLILFGRFNLYLRSFFTSSGILFYLLITGTQPSILRASIMALVILLTFVTNRSSSIINSLALSALLILIIDPGEIFLPGFQLSYAAVLSTALVYPRLSEALDITRIESKALKNILSISFISIAAQIGVLPFVLFYFSKLSLTSILANLIVIPLIGLILGAAFVTVTASFISAQTAVLFASSTDLMNILLVKFIRIMGEPSYSFLWAHDFTKSDIIVFYCSIILFFFFYKKMKKIISKTILLILTVLIVLVYISIDNKELFEEGKLSCYMIDVGQGDAFLLRFPSGTTALIDAGEVTSGFDTGERIIEPILNYNGIKQIDYAFVSHLDNDHYSGFVHLVHKGFIKKLFKPTPDSSFKELRFEKFLKKNNINLSYYKGNTLNIDGARIYIFDNSNLAGLSDNDRGGVILVSYGRTNLLFTGDAGISAENYYLNKYGDFLRCDVLKISHHGSASATSEEFLYITRPAICLISAGEKNKFGHPSVKVLDRLKKFNTRIYCTDKEGGVLLQSDGFKINEINWKKI